MSDVKDRTWLALEAATHHRKERGHDYCAVCSVTWPCTVRRLADAYQGMEDRAMKAEAKIAAAPHGMGIGAHCEWRFCTCFKSDADERYIILEDIPGKVGHTHLYKTERAAVNALARMQAKYPDREYEYIKPKEVKDRDQI